MSTAPHHPRGPLLAQRSETGLAWSRQARPAESPEAAFLLAFVAIRCRMPPLLAYAGGLEVPSSNLGAPT
jgi:hypothetical protein